MKKTAIFMVNDKGGVGKTATFNSIVSLLCSNYFSEKTGHTPTVAALSADPQNTASLQLLGGLSLDATKTVSLIDIDKADGRDELINLLDTYAMSNVIIVDFKANSIKVLQEVLGNADDFFQNYIDEGFDVVVLTPLDKTDDSANSIKVAVETYGDLPTYVTLINEYTVDKSDFNSVYHKAYKAKSLPALNGYKHKEVSMPKMDGIVPKLNAAQMAYFDDQADAGDILTRAEKTRWRGYREKVLGICNILLDVEVRKS